MNATREDIGKRNADYYAGYRACWRDMQIACERIGVDCFAQILAQFPVDSPGDMGHFVEKTSALSGRP